MADQPNILQAIAQKTLERVAADKLACPPEEMERQAREIAQAELAGGVEQTGAPEGQFAYAFEAALRAPGMSFICEVKKASPSKGVIDPDFDYLRYAYEYEAAGASAISCLTEPHWFLGSDDYLRQIASQVATPVLRKDFVVDEYMVYQAKVLGAAAVLLIAAILDDAQLRSYGDLAHELGMGVLFEAHDEDEIRRVAAAGARVVGVNNRNLKTFSVDAGRAGRMRDLVSADVVFVSESGIKTREDVEPLEKAGVDAVLVGEALMRATDKKAALDGLRGGPVR